MSAQGAYEKPSIFQELGEESEEWRSPADFYLEPDNVTRGLTLPGLDAPPLPDYGCKGLPDIDFFHEPGLQKDVTFDSTNEGLPSYLFQQNVGYSAAPSIFQNAIQERFSEHHHPPPAPADEFYKFTPTTLYVHSGEPWRIGNILLGFFADQVVSALSKVKLEKFTFKGDVFENFLMCTMKVRVFQQEHMKFAIEFQRRLGDTVAFSNTFHKANEFLKSHGIVVAGPNVQRASPLPPSSLSPIQQSIGVDEASLEVLLDMTSVPSLQADAAAALATIAEDNINVAGMCTERVLSNVKLLLNASVPEVDYPTSRLVHRLARQHEAAPHYAQQGYLPVMVKKIRSTATCTPAREELARALNAAAQSMSKIALPRSVEFAQMLDESINEMEAGHCNPSVVQNLRSAQMTLSSR